MLILTRKPSEVIRIGEDITITVVSITHNQVRIGIEAPRSVSVHRQEVYDRIKAEKLIDRDALVIGLSVEPVASNTLDTYNVELFGERRINPRDPARPPTDTGA